MSGKLVDEILVAIYSELSEGRNMVLHNIGDNIWIQVVYVSRPDIIIAVDDFNGTVVASHVGPATVLGVGYFQASLSDPESIDRLERFIGRE